MEYAEILLEDRTQCDEDIYHAIQIWNRINFWLLYIRYTRIFELKNKISIFDFLSACSHFIRNAIMSSFHL